MSPDEPADVARARRIAEIRARRGTEERKAAIEALQGSRRATKARPPSESERKTPENSADMFGHPWPVWFRMRDVGYEFIAARARQRQKTTYGQLWDGIQAGVGEKLGTPWRQLPNLLGYIADHSYDETRLVVTALVIYDETDEHPGPGFFRLAARHGLIPESEAPPLGRDAEWKGMTPVQRQFWEGYCAKLFEHLSPPDPDPER